MGGLVFDFRRGPASSVPPRPSLIFPFTVAFAITVAAAAAAATAILTFTLTLTLILTPNITIVCFFFAATNQGSPGAY